MAQHFEPAILMRDTLDENIFHFYLERKECPRCGSRSFLNGMERVQHTATLSLEDARRLFGAGWTALSLPDKGCLREVSVAIVAR